MGQVPAMTHKTLLSLGRTDKADKPYLIGVFGQGGSSAFSISEYSIVVTRRAADIRKPGEDDGAGWSIVREIQPKGRRDPYYAYLAVTEDGAVPRVDAAEADKAGFANGAHFCHINYDFGASDSAIARSMYPVAEPRPVQSDAALRALRFEGHARANARHRASARQTRAHVRARRRARQSVRRAAGGIGGTSWQTQHFRSSTITFDDLPVADLGTISIRVFVLPPKPKKGAEKQVALPLDVQEGEEFLLDQQGATPVSSYLEVEPRQALRCVPGQRPAPGVRSTTASSCRTSASAICAPA